MKDIDMNNLLGWAMVGLKYTIISEVEQIKTESDFTKSIIFPQVHMELYQEYNYKLLELRKEKVDKL